MPPPPTQGERRPLPILMAIAPLVLAVTMVVGFGQNKSYLALVAARPPGLVRAPRPAARHQRCGGGGDAGRCAGAAPRRWSGSVWTARTRLTCAGTGPHGLIAGTTGAGKSELWRTLVASLAVANRPDAMVFVLVDYKGGSTFKDCVDLPHTAGMVTDLDSHLVERALESISTGWDQAALRR